MHSVALSRKVVYMMNNETKTILILTDGHNFTFTAKLTTEQMERYISNREARQAQEARNRDERFDG